jgi:hypothetical protein
MRTPDAGEFPAYGFDLGDRVADLGRHQPDRPLVQNLAPNIR